MKKPKIEKIPSVNDLKDVEQALSAYIIKLENNRDIYQKKSNRARYWLNCWQVVSGIATFIITVCSAAIAFLFPSSTDQSSTTPNTLKFLLMVFTALSSVAANTIIRFRFEEKWQIFESAKNDYDALISRGRFLLATHKNIEITKERKYGVTTKEVTLHDDNALLLGLESKIHDDIENRLFVISKDSSKAEDPLMKKEIEEIKNLIEKNNPKNGSQCQVHSTQEIKNKLEDKNNLEDYSI